ncbi:thioredoxin domain-containing protein (plasmid) [Telmatobacter bradus]|uniref:thioredoxin domain-containing protein n=1 Tax=Telmatobacter bradus TaxID=474953 RepID=UPI003B438574
MLNNVFSQFFLALAVGISFLTSLNAQANKCTIPSDSIRAKVLEYVSVRYKIASKADLTLIENKQANDACFWIFKYQAPQREISIYLSPDGSYLAPTLYDMRVDPRIEEEANRERIAKSLTVGASPSIGPKDAGVTIVEFSDFQCPFCKRMADMLMKVNQDGKVTPTRIVYKFFPLSMHPWAMDAAKVAKCVSMQDSDAFWKVHDYIFANQQQLNAGNVKDRVSSFVVENLKIDQEQYHSCIENDLSLGPVNKDVNLGKSLGVSGTPTLFINGMIYRGIKDVTQLQNIIDGISKNPSKSSSASDNDLIHTGRLISSATTAPKRANECVSKERVQ